MSTWTDSWYIISFNKNPSSWPAVNTHVCLKDAAEGDSLIADLIKDDVRPGWAPDLYRLGYAVVFKRDGLVAIQKKLDESSVDVWVIGVTPLFDPIYCPSTELSADAWWAASRDDQVPVPLGAPYLAPGGATVNAPAIRLMDAVASITKTKAPQRDPLPLAKPTTQSDEATHDAGVVGMPGVQLFRT